MAKEGSGVADYTTEELTQARRQLSSVLHKTREVVSTLQAKEDPGRYKSQITLARRRAEAFALAIDLIDEKLTSCPPAAKTPPRGN